MSFENMVNMLNFSVIFIFIFFSLLINCQKEASWNDNNFPDPWKEPTRCGHFLPAYICDPDGLLTTEQVSNLNDKLWKNGKEKCVCENCNLGRGGLATLVAIMSSSKVPVRDMQEFGDKLRLHWKFGGCENDVIILVTNRKVSLSVGKVANKILELSELTDKLFDASKAFDNGSIYQVLDTMIEILIQASRSKKIVDLPPFPVNYSSVQRSVQRTSLGTELNETANLTVTLFESPRTRPTITKLPNLSPQQAVSSPSQNTPFVMAEQYDEIDRSRRRDYTLVAVVTASVLGVLAIVIVIFALIVWYQRTRTGNIGLFSRKKPEEPKPTTAIEATRYEKCKQAEDE